MNVKILFFNIVILLLITYNCTSQNNLFKFNLVEGPNGKPLGKINAIAQDPYGYMWFAGQGEKCIYRFDGNQIITYKHEDGNPNSLGNIHIETIHIDDAGMIWIGGGGGLDRYNAATGIFKHYRHDKKDSGSLSDGFIFTIANDAQGRLWVGTGNGLDRLDEKTGKFVHYRNEPGNEKSLSSNCVWRLYKDRQGVLWIAGGNPWDEEGREDGGLNRLNQDGTFTRYMHDPNNPHSLINNKIAAMYEDSRGVFWVGTSGDGLHTMDRKTGSFERHLYDPAMPEKLSRPPLKTVAGYYDKITFITGDSAGAIWIGTMYSGINRYDYGTKKITHFNSSHGFPDSTSWNAFTSRDGIVWISTQNSNLLYQAVPSLHNVPAINTGSNVNCFVEDKEGFIWAGSSKNGLQKYNQQKKLLQEFKPDSAKEFSLFNNRIISLFQNQEDSIWIGSDDGIAVFNKRTGLFSRFQLGFSFKGREGSPIYTIFQDRQGLKWFATGEGLVRYNPADGSVKRYLTTEKDSNAINSNRIINFLEDRTGEFWVGVLNGGINRLIKGTDRFTHYLKGFNGICMYEDTEGTIWAGTNRGLYRYNKKEDRFYAFFDPLSEISTEYIYGIVEDNLKNLWISTQSAIIKINTAKNDPFIYGSKYGIPPGSISPNAIYKTREGQFLIGNEKGFYAFFPEELAVNTHLEIILTDFFINSLPVLPGKESVIQKPVEEISDLVLKYNQNNITFNFAAIDYREPETTRYFTMLENYDNVWREVKGKKSSNYFSLPQGDYVYRIKVFNGDGTKAEKQISIHINPPWWQTWWAYTLYAFLLVSSIWAFITWRTMTLQKEKVILEEKVSDRTKELKEEKELVESTLKKLKTTQDQLIQSEKMASLGELTSGIAHEIKNPLNFINNFSEINLELLTEIEEDHVIKPGIHEDEWMSTVKTLKKNSEKINQHGQRVDAIVKSMLQHSRTGNLVKESVNMNSLCEETLQLAYNGFKSKEKTFTATLELHLDPGLPKILCIPQDLGRVILNIINNAFYAIHEKKKKYKSAHANSIDQSPDTEYNPTLILTTKKISKSDTDFQISILISDNGMGIPQDIINKVFQPFFTTKPTGEGTGLGLSMSYDIITKGHGGEIHVKSKEGMGTEFEILLQ